MRKFSLSQPREKIWANFAKRYNGPLYKENRYDMRLEEAYQKFSVYNGQNE